MSKNNSALDILLEWCNAFTMTRKMGEPAAAELAQLRADLQAAQERIAEQARQLDEARAIIETVSTLWDRSKYFNAGYNEMCRTWLAANPAPSAEPQPPNGEGRP